MDRHDARLVYFCRPGYFASTVFGHSDGRVASDFALPLENARATYRYGCRAYRAELLLCISLCAAVPGCCDLFEFLNYHQPRYRCYQLARVACAKHSLIEQLLLLLHDSPSFVGECRSAGPDLWSGELVHSRADIGHNRQDEVGTDDEFESNAVGDFLPGVHDACVYWYVHSLVVLSQMIANRYYEQA